MKRFSARKGSKFALVYLFASLTVALGSHAHAQAKISWHLVFEDNLDKVATMGVKRIGGKSLQDLKRENKDVYYQYQDQVKFQNPDHTRRETAHWSKEGPNLMSGQHLGAELTWNTVSQINVHETLPRSGVDDDNFTKSAVVQTLIEIKKLKETHPELMKDPAAEKALVDRLNNARSGGVTAVGGGGDYRVAEFVRALICALFDRMNSEDPSRKLTVPQFHQLMDLIESLQINFRDGIPAGRYEYWPQERKLYTPEVGVNPETADLIGSSIENFIEDLRKGLPN